VSPTISFRWSVRPSAYPWTTAARLEWVGWCHRSKLPCGASSDNYRHVSRDLKTASPAQQKEMVKNGGTDYHPKGDPWRVNVHDFEDKKLGKVVALWRVRYDHQCRLRQRRDHQRHRRVRRAVDPLLARVYGTPRCPHARELTITADRGGSNGARLRIFKRLGSAAAWPLGGRSRRRCRWSGS
jgi:hypothetical protein